MRDERNYFAGIPMTCIPGMERCNVLVQTQVAFRPTYLVIPAIIAPDFMIEDIKIGKNSEFVSGAAISATVFSGDVVVLKDKVVKAVSDLPLAMKMDDWHPENTLCLTVFNLNTHARNFLGAIVGPPLPAMDKVPRNPGFDISQIADDAKRPRWAQIKQATRVWSEDDATVGHSDHENVESAFKRIYGVPMPAPAETWDDGEVLYKRLPMGIVVCSSYPGNSEIRVWLDPDAE